MHQLLQMHVHAGVQMHPWLMGSASQQRVLVAVAVMRSSSSCLLLLVLLRALRVRHACVFHAREAVVVAGLLFVFVFVCCCHRGAFRASEALLSRDLRCALLLCGAAAGSEAARC
jgi:hypothetical protein